MSPRRYQQQQVMQQQQLPNAVHGYQLRTMQLCDQLQPRYRPRHQQQLYEQYQSLPRPAKYPLLSAAQQPMQQQQASMQMQQQQVMAQQQQQQQRRMMGAL